MTQFIATPSNIYFSGYAPARA